MHPDFKGRIYDVTIPAGLLVRQRRAGGRIIVGNMTWTVQPDPYFSGLKAVKRLIEADDLVDPSTIYATNQLAIMVPKGDPAGVKGLADFGSPGLKLAMPSPDFEGVARQITKASGSLSKYVT